MEATTIKQIELCFENEEAPESGHVQGNNTPVGDNNPELPEVATLSEEGTLPPYVITGEQLLLAEYKEDRFLVQDLILSNIIGTIVGSSDTGKSLLCKQLSMAVVERHPDFLGLKLNVEHGSVIYIATEDDARSFQSYFHKRGLEDDLGLYRNLRIMEDADNLVKKIKAELERKPADLVIIDVFTDAYSGDMNQSNSVRGFLKPYQRLINEFGTTILFTHHTGKRTESQEPSKNNILGSQGYESRMRFAAELRRDHSDPSVRHLCVVKANYLADEQKNLSIVLKLNTDLTFYPTGDRIPKELLGAGGPRLGLKQNPEVIQMISELKDQGLSARKIEAELKQRGVKAGKTTISEVMKQGQ